MIKWIPIIAVLPVLLWSTVFVACVDEKPTKLDPPKRDEILYDRDSGECWVIKRTSDGQLSESMYHSKQVNDCYQFTLKGEKYGGSR
jgi:hypothetical protein